MRKIPSLFDREAERRPDGSRKVIDVWLPSSLWVANGEGRATRKWDGQAVLVEKGQAFTRYDAKAGRTPPPDFVPAQPLADPVTGHWPGWVPVTKVHKFVLEALEWGKVNLTENGVLEDGTYEAVGPKIGTRHGANPEGLTEHRLVRHGVDPIDAPRDFAGLMEFLRDLPVEGVVWHHPDGRMAKIKKSDFPY